MEVARTFLFYAFSFTAVVFSLIVVRARNIFYGVLALGLVFVSVAGIYFTIGAEFIAGIQILIYVGGVITVLLFSIMLTKDLYDLRRKVFTQAQFLSLLSTLLLGILTGAIIVFHCWSSPSANNIFLNKDFSSALSLGKTLMSDFIIHFELLSVLLLAALIGAIIIARKGESDDRH